MTTFATFGSDRSLRPGRRRAWSAVGSERRDKRSELLREYDPQGRYETWGDFEKGEGYRPAAANFGPRPASIETVERQTDVIYRRGELDARGIVIEAPGEFTEWAAGVSDAINGRKRLTEYGAQTMPGKLADAAGIILSGIEDATIGTEIGKRRGAADLFAGAFLAMEIVDVQPRPADAQARVAATIADAWADVLDGRVADLETDQVLVNADAPDGAPGIMEERSWSTAESVGERQSASDSQSADDAPKLARQSRPMTSACPSTWPRTVLTMPGASAPASSAGAIKADSQDSADPNLDAPESPRTLPPAAYGQPTRTATRTLGISGLRSPAAFSSAPADAPGITGLRTEAAPAAPANAPAAQPGRTAGLRSRWAGYWAGRRAQQRQIETALLRKWGLELEDHEDDQRDS